MLPSHKLERINELARKKKTAGLSELETKEQQKLREEYLKAFRTEFRKRLDDIEIVDGPSGSHEH